ncbi:MAG: histidine phosphotransferase family protein [Alphaproteobacteria bacterium]|nr:histidine phosphotransferase family protein [Alphaproteobacteria bacterium]
MSQIDHAPTAAELAALLCSRVCHDIAGPTSAMGAALSVLADEGAADMRDDAIDLLRTGAVSIRNKLEYARVCFGAAGSRGGEMTIQEIRAVAEPMFADARAELVFKTEAGALDKSAGRVLLNLIWMAIESLPRGGTVTVEASASSDGGARLRIVASGPRIRLEPAFAAALGGERPEDGYDGRSIQAYYAGLIAREAGGRAAASASEERAEFTALTGPVQTIAAAE